MGRCSEETAHTLQKAVFFKNFVIFSTVVAAQADHFILALLFKLHNKHRTVISDGSITLQQRNHRLNVTAIFCMYKLI